MKIIELIIIAPTIAALVWLTPTAKLPAKKEKPANIKPAVWVVPEKRYILPESPWSQPAQDMITI